LRNAGLQLLDEIEHLSITAEQLVRATKIAMGLALRHHDRQAVERRKVGTMASIRAITGPAARCTLGIATGLGFLIGCILSRPAQT
jgi:hypothetical protein